MAARYKMVWKSAVNLVLSVKTCEFVHQLLPRADWFSSTDVSVPYTPSSDNSVAETEVKMVGVCWIDEREKLRWFQSEVRNCFHCAWQYARSFTDYITFNAILFPSMIRFRLITFFRLLCKERITDLK